MCDDMNTRSLFVVSILMVSVILILLNLESMYNYSIYTQVIENSEINSNYTHTDYLLVNSSNYPGAIKNIALLEDESIDVIFSNTNQTILGNIPDFTYKKNFIQGDSFVFKCNKLENGMTQFNLFQYLGTTYKDGTITLVMSHKESASKMDVACNYPEVIQYSLNMGLK